MQSLNEQVAEAYGAPNCDVRALYDPVRMAFQVTLYSQQANMFFCYMLLHELVRDKRALQAIGKRHKSHAYAMFALNGD